jgi:hypothetical protein
MTDQNDSRMLWSWLTPAQDATPAQRAAAESAFNTIALPRERMFAESVAYIVGELYGFRESARLSRPVDGEGKPLPLYTYPAIHYLDSLEWRNADVFEFGAGNSTLWWAQRARSVTSVENNASWYAELSAQLPGSARVILETTRPLGRAMPQDGAKYHVIVVDCGDNRYVAAEAAAERLADNGLILLDNAEWYPQTAALLRNAGLIEIDFAGLKPSEFHTSITSLFLKPGFRPVPKGARMPGYPIGGKRRYEVVPQPWDLPLER